MNLFDDGFRPFFLGAAAVAAIHVFLWLAFLSGDGISPQGWSPMVWHAHEMVFGFAAALIAGFLLTAVGNWTGRQVAGPALMAGLFALWLAARVAVGWSAIPAGWSQALAAAFFPALTVVVAVPVLRARNARNYPVIAILTLLSAAGIAVHLLSPMAVLRAATDLLLLLMLFVGARVIPFFTGRRLPQLALRNSPRLGWITLVTAAGAVFSGWVFARSPLLAALQGTAGVLVILQLCQWKPWRTLGEPMLWILHLGFLWLGMALLLRAAPLPPAAALHALTVGALGCLSIGMMARVALGHSGREIRADDWIVTAFVLVALAVIPRLLYPMLGFNGGRMMLLLSGALWALGFLVYFLRFLPVMLTPRR
jgi:uncharacterized protein involved in response to NO